MWTNESVDVTSLLRLRVVAVVWVYGGGRLMEGTCPSCLCHVEFEHSQLVRVECPSCSEDFTPEQIQQRVFGKPSQRL